MKLSEKNLKEKVARNRLSSDNFDFEWSTHPEGLPDGEGALAQGDTADLPYATQISY